MTKQELISNIPTMERLYCIFSAVTHMPYLECNPETDDDEVYVFVDEKFAQTTASMMKEKFGKPVLVVSAEKKDLLRLFGSMKFMGVTAVCFSDNGSQEHIALDEIVRPISNDNRPEYAKLVNKDLQSSMIYYLQERRNLTGDPADEEVIKELEEEMLLNIRKANYLVITMISKDRSQQAMMLLSRGDGNTMIPLFTDMGEVERFARSQKENQNLAISIATLSQLCQMGLPENVGGFLINPATAAFPLTKEYAQQLVNHEGEA